ncbi:MAG: flavodoxin-dependent (E)-4-hydroxy-3-methylbut-2-enyl-diphosphate synthase, partial [Bacilli bacterium]|nr:flavodoxin-dependent (E)-4-hydroxy-3-methylbut-2-enyl-diphosphate synthase [Bacilli bacterium]
TLISCPTCGRTRINLEKLALEVERRLEGITEPITVAVMGCVVNGPGEAKDSDLGLAGGKNAFTFFKKGKPVKTLKEDEAIKLLFEEIDKF